MVSNTTEETFVYNAKVHNKSEKPQKVKILYSAPEEHVEDVEHVEVIEPASHLEIPSKTYNLETETVTQPKKYGIKEIQLVTDEVVEKPVERRIAVQPQRVVEATPVIKEEVVPVVKEELVQTPTRHELYEYEIAGDTGLYELYPKREMRVLPAHKRKHHH